MIEEIRQKKPIVHCITNAVTIYDCANILVAIGASPIMAHHIDEVEEITSKASALVINLGATDDYEAIEKSVAVANYVKIPVVMDPVGCATSTYRRNFALKLITKYHVDCIRGNYSEVMAILDEDSTAAGLDNKLSADDLPLDRILDYARCRQMLIYASGKLDYIFDGHSGMEKSDVETGIYQLQFGDTMLTTITGSGCMLSTLVGSALAISNSVDVLVELCERYGGCAKFAAEKTREVAGGSMTFHTKFIDEISKL